MSEVLATFESPVAAPDGSLYRAQACGAPADDNTQRWEGWVEFMPLEGGEPLRSRRETTQPNRDHTIYWASGLSNVYLRGTLERTLSPAPTSPPVQIVRPMFESPAPPADVVPQEPGTSAVLNPFSIYRKSETLLRDQLGALSNRHLANIIRSYTLSDLNLAALERATQRDLIELIVAAVRMRAAG